MEQQNCKILSSYSPENTDIKNLFPIGLNDKNELIGKFEKLVLAFKEYRKLYLTFHGFRKGNRDSKDVKEMMGFYQEDFNSTSGETLSYTS